MSSAATALSEAPAAPAPVRAADGRFPKGVSGNPAGKKPGTRNHIVELQRNLEVAIREHLAPGRVCRIVNKIAEMAENGNVHAAKLILDKLIPNATPGEDSDKDTGRTIVFKIENATVQALQQNVAASESREAVVRVETDDAIEAEFTESSGS